MSTGPRTVDTGTESRMQLVKLWEESGAKGHPPKEKKLPRFTTYLHLHLHSICIYVPTRLYLRLTA